jgi:hypothetical protein
MKQYAWLGLVVVLMGCGSSTPPVKMEERLFKGTTPDDRAKIEEALKKANIQGQIVGIEKAADFWTVSVNKSSVGPDGKRRGGNMMPDDYQYDPNKGEIIKGKGAGKRGGATD